jgi:hypothetical protein
LLLLLSLLGSDIVATTDTETELGSGVRARGRTVVWIRHSTSRTTDRLETDGRRLLLAAASGLV